MDTAGGVIKEGLVMDGPNTTELIRAINRKRNQYSRTGEFPELTVYIGREKWIEIMNELYGELSGAAYSMFYSEGKTIMDYKVYKVLEDDHGIVVVRKEDS
jgi:hypothetical protein